MKVGILGGGQLGRMLSLAGYPLGLRFRHLDPKPSAPTGPLDEQITAPYDDPEALDRFARGLDVVTYEFENVPLETARRLGEQVPVRPPPQALEVAQDRLEEKNFFRELGLETARFLAVDTRKDLEESVAALGLPAVLKTRRFGYDGKGQVILREPADLDPGWDELGGRPLILEQFVEYERELSILGVRGLDGSLAFYPPVENHHHEGILWRSLAPAPSTSPETRDVAERYGRRVLEALEYVGVVAVELFQVDDGLLANEMAPRVHNSGHWSIEGAEISQFENHIRAVTGRPLGQTDPVGHCAMVNLLGGLPDLDALLEVPGSHLHLYEKEPRPRRKIGHVTVRAADEAGRDERLERLLQLIPEPRSRRPGDQAA